MLAYCRIKGGKTRQVLTLFDALIDGAVAVKPKII